MEYGLYVISETLGQVEKPSQMKFSLDWSAGQMTTHKGRRTFWTIWNIYKCWTMCSLNHHVLSFFRSRPPPTKIRYKLHGIFIVKRWPRNHDLPLVLPAFNHPGTLLIFNLVSPVWPSSAPVFHNTVSLFMIYVIFKLQLSWLCFPP